jgi:hypothetical protein
MKKHSAIDFMDQKMFFDLIFVNKDISLSQLASRNNPKNLTSKYQILIIGKEVKLNIKKTAVNKFLLPF